MNKLPSEILQKIFIHVPFKERLECTLVCRYWYHSLGTRDLYYDIEIRNDNIFHQFINLLQRLPSCASQVEILTLKVSPTFDKRLLYNMLPNLRVFKYSDSSLTNRRESHYNKPFALTNLNSKLEVIQDGGECELTRQLSMFGSFTRLRHLDLKLNVIDKRRKELFIYLKSAPILEELILRYGSIGMEDIEIIHKNIPALESLELFRVMLIAGEMPLDVIPVTTVKKFAMIIDEVRDYINYPGWYAYLAKKYTSMTSFHYFDKEIMNLDSNQMMKIYRDGLFPIYKAIACPLPIFGAKNIPTALNPFYTIDEFGLRVSKFYLKNNETRPIFEQLAGSKHAKYVESIELYNTAIGSPVLLESFTSLRVLMIDMRCRHPKWNVNLKDYFNACPPTLTTFSAHFCDIEINELPSNPNNIEYLNIDCSILYPKLGQVISSCFPKLNTLILRGRVTKKLNIHLPENHFKKINISVDHSGNQRHRFLITNKHSSISEPHYYGNTHKHIEYSTDGGLQDEVTVSTSFASVASLCCDDLYIDTKNI